MQKFRTVYNTHNVIDTVYHDTYMEAVQSAHDIMIGWMEQFITDADEDYSRDKWDYMVDNSETFVEVYNEKTDAWEVCWEADQTDLDELGFVSTDNEASEFWNLVEEGEYDY